MAKNIVVIDGDTFMCDSEGKTRTIRLDDVDAPKSGEPFTKEATSRLEKLIAGKNITLKVVGISWGELVCLVKVDGESVNEAMNSFLSGMKKPAQRKPTQRKLAQRHG